MDSIKLPDGRIIPVKSIRNQVRNRTNHNLRTRKTTKPKPKYTPIKYTLQERVWMATEPVDDIQARYQVSPETAQSLKYQSRYILQRLDLDVAEIQRLKQELDTKNR